MELVEIAVGILGTIGGGVVGFWLKWHYEERAWIHGIEIDKTIENQLRWKHEMELLEQEFQESKEENN